MLQSDQISEMYEGYYADGAVANKRNITSIQTIDHIKELIGEQKFDSILDIGAGEGAVLDKLHRSGIGKSLAAVEISQSGIDAIKARKIPSLNSVQKFDGYKLPFKDKEFDLGLAIHVVEHVEHERLFLREAIRVCRYLYVEVPLEHTSRIERSIRISGPSGHINFYTPQTFDNLLRTTGLKPINSRIFSHSLAYEQLWGKQKGWLKYQIRTGFLKFAPSLATRHMMYMLGVLCTAD